MSEYRTTPTGSYRFTLRSRWFREPLIVLQAQYNHEKYVLSFNGGGRWKLLDTTWENVSLGDLSTMSLTDLTKPREAGDFPICFSPRKSIFGWQLVLMVCDGAYDGNNWRPARLQDLTLKDGKITGGLGLVRR